MKKRLLIKAGSLFIVCISLYSSGFCQWSFSTDYFKIHINGKGWITSMENITVQPGREFSPAGDPSPLLCLYNSQKNQYYYPQKAAYSPVSGKMVLRY
ncbi:MAG: hypothetical protein EPN37_06885, partial [Chitinophagaceae bacterium]